MNTQTLLCFITAAELNNFTKAANQLYITQSALSKAISNLESELNCSLFEKEGRRMILTAAGKEFYKHAVKALSEINEGIAKAQYMARQDMTTLTLSVLFCPYAYQLPELLFPFRSRHPNCNISITYKYTSNILKDLLNDSCDLGICGFFPSTGMFQSLERHILFREAVDLAVGYNHRFADRDEVDGSELRNESFIIWNRSQLGINKLLYDLGREYNFTPNITQECFHDFGVSNAVAAGEGVAIFPGTVEHGSARIKRIKLHTDIPFTRDIFLVWRHNRNLAPHAIDFRDMLISASALS